MNLRLDKFISDYTELTRSQAKKAIRAGEVSVNGNVTKKGDDKVSFSDSVLWKEKEIRGQKYQYIMLNKPAGIVSATVDEHDTTVVEHVLRTEPVTGGDTDVSGMPPLAKDLFPMGRLDKDTEGLLIVTNDGELAHRLLSPKYHVEKKYFVRLDAELEPGDEEAIKKGLDIGEKRITKPAKLEALAERECYLTITEGKFHQVKRMFAALGKHVVYLKRVTMGAISLDEMLPSGGWRFLTEKEIAKLKGEYDGEE